MPIRRRHLLGAAGLAAPGLILPPALAPSAMAQSRAISLAAVGPTVLQSASIDTSVRSRPSANSLSSRESPLLALSIWISRVR